MAKELTIGIAKIEFADVLPTGGPGTEFFVVGQTLQDSFSLTTDEGTAITINVEEQELPIYDKPTQGAKTVNFSIVNFDFTDLVKVAGGTADATKWSSPERAFNGEFTIRITPEAGYVIMLNRVRVRAVLDGSLGRTSNLNLVVTGSVMQPTLEGVESMDLLKQA